MVRFFNAVQLLPSSRHRNFEEQMRTQHPVLDEMLSDVFFMPLSSRNRGTFTRSSDSCCRPLSSLRLLGMKRPWIQDINMVGFQPSDIKVKIEGNSVVIHARKEDVHGENIDVQERKRVIAIPEGVDKNRITCRCNRAGNFIIKGIYQLDDEDAQKQSTERTTNMMSEKHITPKLDLSAEENIDQKSDPSDQQTDHNDSDNQSNDVRTVTEDSGASEVEQYKPSVLLPSELMVELLARVNHVSDRISGHGSPIPSEEFVIVEDNFDGIETTDLTEKKNEDGADVPIAFKDDKTCFNVTLPLKDFPVDSISVRCKDSHLYVDAKHEWNDGDMVRSREIHRMYQLPENAIKSDARASFSADGLFSITVPIVDKQDDKKCEIAIEQE